MKAKSRTAAMFLCVLLPALTGCLSVPPLSATYGSGYQEAATGVAASRDSARPGVGIIRQRIARYDPETLLSRKDLKSISMHLFADLSISARQIVKQTGSNGFLAWSGAIESAEGGTLVVVVREGYLYVSAYLPASIVQIRPVAALTGEDSRDYIIREIASPCRSGPDFGSGAELTPGEKKLVELVNLERGADGLRVLGCSALLTEAARRHARDMARHDVCSHSLSTGEEFYENVFESGYPFSTVGENLAVGYQTPEETFECMLASPEHRINILTPRYTQIGVGEVVDTRTCYAYFWAQEFGSAKE